MPRVAVLGTGAVSPAGWGTAALRSALDQDIPISCREIPRPGWRKPILGRTVPGCAEGSTALRHPRLRRASSVSHFASAAAQEALSSWHKDMHHKSSCRLGIIVSLMTGCISYSHRLYDEILKDPSTTSPLLFPEATFNSPASHVAAIVGNAVDALTLIGDEGAFLQGLSIGAHWLLDDKVDECLVIGASEMDWLVGDAVRLFSRGAISADGAGALLLGRSSTGVPAIELEAVTDSYSYGPRMTRKAAALRMRGELTTPNSDEVLLLGTRSLPTDSAELEVWEGAKAARLAPKQILGEGLTASTAWHCVAGCDWIRRKVATAATISVVGANQQAIGARFRVG